MPLQVIRREAIVQVGFWRKYSGKS